jgi:hypothetical protein
MIMSKKLHTPTGLVMNKLQQRFERTATVGLVIVCAGLLLAVLLLLFAAPATAQTATRSYYDARGSFAGQSFTRGNSTSFSDGRGRFSGSSIRHGNGTSFYDARGRFTGSVINTGPRR